MASTSGNQVQMTPTSGSPLVQMTSTSGNQVQSVQGGMKGTEEYIDFLCSLHDVPNKTTPAQSSPDNLHKLKVALTTWKEERQRYKGEQESRKAEIRESKTEIYQMIGFYSVLQGVLFQGVSSMAKLESGWKIFIFSATLSVLASAATIGVVDLKLRDLKQSTMQFSDAQKMVQVCVRYPFKIRFYNCLQRVSFCVILLFVFVESKLSPTYKHREVMKPCARYLSMADKLVCFTETDFAN
ncbi:hypothetical protein M758_1G333200 [Ceratodon purpureus]|nr:hypothetical protein M758_1G333200 [Ceratodon purpureus]